MRGTSGTNSKKEQFESKGVAAWKGRFSEIVLSQLICCSFKYIYYELMEYTPKY
jgi:hypothetical protein